MDTGGENTPPQNIAGRRLIGAAVYVIAVAIGLLPAFYIPFSSAPLILSKSYLFLGAVMVALILFLIGSILNRRVSIPRNALLPLLVFLPLIYALSAWYSQNPSLSFVGPTLEIDTALMMAGFSAVALLGALLFLGRGIVPLLLVSLVGAGIILVAELVHLAVGIPSTLFSARTANLVGKWNDLAIYFGLLFILAMHVTTFFRPVSRQFSLLLWGILGASLLVIVAVNFFEVWVAIAIAAGAFSVFGVREAFRQSTSTPVSLATVVRNIPRIPAIALAISLMFILFHAQLSVFIGNTISVFQIEARPSWQSTLEIAAVTYSTDPLLGSGPGTFGEQWLLHKPAGINETPFWGVRFDQGVGLVPTALTTTGLLGGLAWLLLLGVFIWYGIKLLRRGLGSVPSVITLSYIIALYLFLMAMFYLPGIALLALGFLVLGIFIANYERERGAQPLVVPLTLRPFGILGALGVAASLVLIGGSCLALYEASNRLIAGINYQKALNAFSNGDLEKAEADARAAALREPGNASPRLLAEVGFSLLNRIATTPTGSLEERTKQFEAVAAAAIEAGFGAIRSDNRNPANWIMLGRLYELIFSVGATQAYEDAKIAYSEAALRSPHDPSIYLMLARLEAARGDGDTARQYIARALQEKGNYTAAIFFLSQLEVSEGNITDAISSSEAALTFEPNDPLLWFQLGFLHYSQGVYQKSAEALERAVALREDYANARYFLGLSYYELRRPVDSRSQFERISELNPGNAEIALILANLSAGKAPLAGTNPPVSTPEKRGNLPVAE